MPKLPVLKPQEVVSRLEAMGFVGRCDAMMEYKGYIGKIEFDDEAGIFHGEVFNARDVIVFQDEIVHELRKVFQESVDDYLAFRASRGEKPDKPTPGNS
jgi:predicted HicB family RNase H-like nuclease